MNDVTVTLVTDRVGLPELRQEWTDLLLDTARPSVFMSWEWMTTWLKEFRPGATPRVLMARRGPDGELVGLAPFYETTSYGPLAVRTLGFMGAGVGADHLAVLVRRGFETQTRAALAERLLADDRWDVLEFPRTEHETAQWLEGAVSASGRRLASISGTADVCPYIPLPGSWEEYLRTLRSDARKDLGRRWRRLREHGDVVIERVHTVDELDHAWSILLALHEKRRQVMGGRSAFTTGRALAFHRVFLQRAAERGWLRLYLMRVRDRYVAAEYCLSLGGKVADLQTGFDPEWSRFGVSTLLQGHSIQDAIAEGATEYDLLRGGEAYKQQRWAAALRSDKSLVVWKRRPQVIALIAARRWAGAAVAEFRRKWPGRRVPRTPDSDGPAAEGRVHAADI